MEILNTTSGNTSASKVFDSPLASLIKGEGNAVDAFSSLLDKKREGNVAAIQYSFDSLLNQINPVAEPKVAVEKTSAPSAVEKADRPEKPIKENKPEPKEPLRKEKEQAVSQDDNVKQEKDSYTAVPSEDNSDYTPTPKKTDVVVEPTPKKLRTPEAGLQTEGTAGSVLPEMQAPAFALEDTAGLDNEINLASMETQEVIPQSEIQVQVGDSSILAPLEDGDISLPANQIVGEEQPILLEQATTTNTAEIVIDNSTLEEAQVLPLETESLLITDAPKAEGSKTLSALELTPKGNEVKVAGLLKEEGQNLPTLDVNVEDGLQNVSDDAKITELKPVETKSVLDMQKEQIALKLAPEQNVKLNVTVTQEVNPAVKEEVLVNATPAVQEETLNIKTEAPKILAETGKKEKADTSLLDAENSIDTELQLEGELTSLEDKSKKTAKLMNDGLKDTLGAKTPESTVKTNSLFVSNAPVADSPRAAANISMPSSSAEGALKSVEAVGVKTVYGEHGNSSTNVQTSSLLKSAKTEKPAAFAGSINPKDIIEQIKVNITKASADGASLDKIKINLRPKELGSIEVSMELNKENQLKTTITANKVETLDALQKDVRILERALSDAGFDIKDNSLSFQLRGENQGKNFAGNGNAQERGENLPLELDEEETTLVSENVMRSDENGLYAVNIKV